jgi:DNA (cytosine-5)-methyltransferase 1
MKSIELFAGAGGLALGIAAEGFEHLAVVERDRFACDTLRENQRRGLSPLAHWCIHQCDIREFDYRPFEGKVDLIGGGPPCQPFSLGGKHQGFLDPRDMFPEAVRSVRLVRPKAFIFENVKGLKRQVFFNYFQYVLLQLEYPEVTLKPGEMWMEHLKRLEKIKTAGRYDGLKYNVISEVINAADVGVPQKRERVVIVGIRSDLGIGWSFPARTHSFDALVYAQSVSGEYWERHRISKVRRPADSPAQAALALKLSDAHPALLAKPWVTVRDALSDLPQPGLTESLDIPNHRFQPGAKSYAGHTGSSLDDPAKTLKAGDHGVPGGENMLRLPDGTVRYFTVRESARLQMFPDDFVFHGSWTENMRQLGNAVPVGLSRFVAAGVAEKLSAKFSH